MTLQKFYSIACNFCPNTSGAPCTDNTVSDEGKAIVIEELSLHENS